MAARQRGFTLMEALLSVLILSVGLLGLGRLQAALWKSAGQLYAQSEAYLLSTSYLEHGLPAIPTQLGSEEIQYVHSVTGYTVFDSILHTGQQGLFTEIDISSTWRDTAGTNTVRLHTAIYRPDTRDSRWLLSLD